MDAQRGCVCVCVCVCARARTHVQNVVYYMSESELPYMRPRADVKHILVLFMGVKLLHTRT
jgi:hypothetical protein